MKNTIQILDYAITVFFVIEISIRFISEPKKVNFFKSGWNVFDTTIVIGSLIPAGGSGILLARLLRVFRVLRLVSMVPELRQLINALIKAIPKMSYIALLMFVIFYIYGAVGSILFEDINKVLWGDVSISMLTLFRIATFEDWTDVMYETMEVFPFSWIFYLSFIFFTAFAFLNMVIGIVVNVMEQENANARAEALEEEGEPSLKEISQQISQLQRQILMINGRTNF